LKNISSVKSSTNAKRTDTIILPIIGIPLKYTLYKISNGRRINNKYRQVNLFKKLEVIMRLMNNAIKNNFAVIGVIILLGNGLEGCDILSDSKSKISFKTFPNDIAKTTDRIQYNNNNKSLASIL